MFKSVQLTYLLINLPSLIKNYLVGFESVIKNISHRPIPYLIARLPLPSNYLISKLTAEYIKCVKSVGNQQMNMMDSATKSTFPNI